MKSVNRIYAFCRDMALKQETWRQGKLLNNLVRFIIHDIDTNHLIKQTVTN